MVGISYYQMVVVNNEHSVKNMKHRPLLCQGREGIPQKKLPNKRVLTEPSSDIRPLWIVSTLNPNISS